jgi:hypothetical protein
MFGLAEFAIVLHSDSDSYLFHPMGACFADCTTCNDEIHTAKASIYFI